MHYDNCNIVHELTKKKKRKKKDCYIYFEVLYRLLNDEQSDYLVLAMQVLANL